MRNRIPTSYNHFPGPTPITPGEERARAKQRVQKDLERFGLAHLRSMAKHESEAYREAIAVAQSWIGG